MITYSKISKMASSALILFLRKLAMKYHFRQSVTSA